MDGYSEADGYGNRKTWRQMRSGQGVADFGKLFTETNEQKFSLGGVQS